MIQYKDLAELLLKCGDAHTLYTTLPMNVQEELINRKETIHTVSELKTAVALLECHDTCCGDL